MRSWFQSIMPLAFNACRYETDGSGSISQMEFEQGWEYVVDEMASDLLETVGLSANHQMVTILLLFTIALLVICFLFLAIYSYNNEDSFASSVQSLLVVASSTLARARPFSHATHILKPQLDTFFLLILHHQWLSEHTAR